jgi:predicted lactoylglutathione lyase
MHKQIFVNLPVRDIARTKTFFSSLGFGFEPKFSNDSALCMRVGENIFAMLLHESFFKTFTPKAVADAREVTEVLVCLSCDSRAQVDDLVKKAIAAGGKALREPQDHGFMYGHGFEDPDGHGWELVYMDPNAEPPHA